MTGRSIPGRLDATGMALLAGPVTDDEYRQRADANRPDDEAVKAQALKLLTAGLRPEAVALALRLDLETVTRWAAP